MFFRVINLHENYVENKACNNIMVVCKHYYKQALTKELVNKNGSATYSCRKEHVEDFIEAHDRYVHAKYNINFPEV